jgi:hypothetical protein
VVDRIEFRHPGHVEARQTTPRVDVRVTAGPAGLPGPPGDPAGLGMVHVQSVPSTLWVINHTLPFKPNVEVVDSTGRVVNVDVRHVSSTLIHVEPAVPFAGSAHLS